MSGRYSAFTFCDRITEHVPAKRARARFLIPPALEEFPPCLVAEATGQLAAWVSMANIGFRGRPVAALAGETRFLADVAPGDLLELEVDVESCDAETVSYAGRASVGGRPVLELVDAVGPMLPQEDYDSPEDLRRQFELLCGDGARPGRFGGVARPGLEPTGGVRGERREALLQVPTAAPFFADHFPRRAVFPATLLLDCQIRFALGLAAENPAWSPATRVRATRMTHVKMRDFVLPGQQVAVSAQMQAADAGLARVALAARVSGRTVATARAEFAPAAED
jgi:3-hydroxymyristoyl/3-hydroxydecanoyl-(acyl carrier protein) dehydratase